VHKRWASNADVRLPPVPPISASISSFRFGLFSGSRFHPGSRWPPEAEPVIACFNRNLLLGHNCLLNCPLQYKSVTNLVFQRRNIPIYRPFYRRPGRKAFSIAPKTITHGGRGRAGALVRRPSFLPPSSHYGPGQVYDDNIGVRRGVSKGVKDGRRWPALREGHR
jgi:hypothetical protein